MYMWFILLIIYHEFIIVTPIDINLLSVLNENKKEQNYDFNKHFSLRTWQRSFICTSQKTVPAVVRPDVSIFIPSPRPGTSLNSPLVDRSNFTLCYKLRAYIFVVELRPADVTLTPWKVRLNALIFTSRILQCMTKASHRDKWTHEMKHLY